MGRTMQIEQHNTTEYLPFLMIDSADHINGKAGVPPTVTISKNGGAFAVPAGAIAEVPGGSEGWWHILPNAGDADTIGPLKIHAEAAGCDPTDCVFEVKAGTVGLSVHSGNVQRSGVPLVGALVQLFSNVDLADAHLVQSTRTVELGAFTLYVAAGTYYQRISGSTIEADVQIVVVA